LSIKQGACIKIWDRDKPESFAKGPSIYDVQSSTLRGKSEIAVERMHYVKVSFIVTLAKKNSV